MGSVLVAQVTMAQLVAQQVGSVYPKAIIILGVSLLMDAPTWSTSSAVDQVPMVKSAVLQATSAEPPTSITQTAELARHDLSSSVEARAGRDQTSRLAARTASCAQLRMSTTLNASLLRPKTHLLCEI